MRVSRVDETPSALDPEAAAAVEQALRRAATPDAVHGILLHDLPEVLGACAASVALLDPSGEWVDVVASRGYEPAVLARLSRFGADADVPLAETIRTDRVILLGTRAQIGGRYPSLRNGLLKPERQAIACTPIRVEDQVIGAVGLSFEHPIDEAGPLPAFLRGLSDLVGAGLSRVGGRGADEVRHLVEAARGRLAFVSGATRALTRSLDQDEVLDTLTQLVVPRFADWASVLLPDGDELVAATLVHRDHPGDDPRQRAGVFRCPIGAPSVSAAVFRTGEAAMVSGIDDDVRARMAAYPELRSSLGATRTRIVVPITAQERTLGILTLGDSGHRPFDDDDLMVAVELATRAGTALDHAARFAAERNMVEVLQRAVLPASLPKSDDFTVSARYLPASLTAKVGGDWYDAFRLRDGRIGLCVGDVVGHGLEAAACMGQLRNALRAYALDGSPPDEVVRALNNFTIDTRTTDFATLLYGIYEPRSGELTWTNAGHPPMLLRRADAVEVLDTSHGLPIGITAGGYGSSTVELVRGDVVLLFTDGLVESRLQPLDEGLGQLTSILASSDASVEGMVDELVLTASGRERADDVCLLAVAHCP